MAERDVDEQLSSAVGIQTAVNDQAQTQTDEGKPALPISASTSKSRTKLAGQKGFNPCICCACCCKGTCTLRTGILTIGITQMFFGVLLLFIALGIQLSSLPKSQRPSRSLKQRQLMDIQKDMTKVLLKIQVDLVHETIIIVLILVGAGVFLIPSGVLATAAYVMKNKIIAAVYSLLMLAAVVFTPIQAYMCSKALRDLDKYDYIPSVVEDHLSWTEDEMKYYLGIFWWGASAFGLALQIHFLCCGIGLFLQYKNRTYEPRLEPQGAVPAESNDTMLRKAEN